MYINSASKHFKTLAFSPTYFKLLGFLFFHTDSVSVPVIIHIGSIGRLYIYPYNRPMDPMGYSSCNISFVRNPLRNGWAMPASAAQSFNAAMPNGLTLAKVLEEPQPKSLFGSSLRSGDKLTLGVQPTKQSGWSLGWSMWRIPYYQWQGLVDLDFLGIHSISKHIFSRNSKQVNMLLNLPI